MMVTIDRAGRVVIPKDVRERLALGPDANLELDVEGGSIRLTPERGPRRSFRVIDGWPVFEAVPGHRITDADVQRLRDADQR
jgi:AbrB family looped-hinge helix DNA binding protein